MELNGYNGTEFDEPIAKQEKSWNQTVFEVKLNLTSLAFTKAIQEEIDKLSVTGLSEYALCSMEGYELGLKKALELFVKVKNEQ